MRWLWALVILSGCGPDVIDGPFRGPPPGEPGAGGRTITISPGASMRSLDAYAENPVIIPSGTTVTWINGDSETHTVTADTDAFDSGPLAPGQSFSHLFLSPGQFTYGCSIHPNMRGTILVEASAPAPIPSTTPPPEPSPVPR